MLGSARGTSNHNSSLLGRKQESKGWAFVVVSGGSDIAFLRVTQKNSPFVNYSLKGYRAVTRCSSGKLERKQHKNKIKIFFGIY